MLNPTGSISWGGILRGGRDGQATVVLTPSGLTANLYVLSPNGASYSIRPLGSGYHAIIYADPSRWPDD